MNLTPFGALGLASQPTDHYRLSSIDYTVDGIIKETPKYNRFENAAAPTPNDTSSAIPLECDVESRGLQLVNLCIVVTFVICI